MTNIELVAIIESLEESLDWLVSLRRGPKELRPIGYCWCSQISKIIEEINEYMEAHQDD